jgi:hypothetical protein
MYRFPSERHERRSRWRARVPVPVQEVTVLRALLVGLCACILVAQAAAAATQDRPSTAPPEAKERSRPTLDERLAQKLEATRKYRGTIAFFEQHRRLPYAPAHREDATLALERAHDRLAQLERTIAALRRAIDARDARRRAAMPPRTAICEVFDGYCRQAVAVAWCESRLATTARNGQYLGLFQMGSYERSLFGHGETAHEQALAAHRYFVSSGRDWSPWGCRWAAG